LEVASSVEKKLDPPRVGESKINTLRRRKEHHLSPYSQQKTMARVGEGATKGRGKAANPDSTFLSKGKRGGEDGPGTSIDKSSRVRRDKTSSSLVMILKKSARRDDGSTKEQQ